jgi:tetratricopeptide (TPR) repeat protein
MRGAAITLAILLNALGGASSQESPIAAPGAPPLPAVVPETFPSSIREKVRHAYAGAVAHPLDPSANGQLGMVLQAYHASDTTAEICYRRARVFEPSSFRWAYYLALIQAEQKKYHEATTTLREALKLDPRYLPAELKLGSCLLASGELDGARNIFEMAVRHHPWSAQAYFKLGRVREVGGDVNAAVESFRKACELFPHFGAAHYSLARTYQRLGKADQARDEFALSEKYKYQSPDAADPLMAELRNIYTDPNYFVELGVQFANRGFLNEAVAEHEKALQLDPHLLKAHVNLISLFGRLRRLDKAEEHYRAAAEISLNDPEIHYDHGVLLMEEGKNTEAEEAFRKVLEIDPAHANAHNNLGDLWQREGKTEAAVEEFRKAIESKPDFPQAHFNLGRILVNQENYKEGIPELLKTLRTQDVNLMPSYLYALGAAYARSGDAKSALRYLRAAREQAVARHQSRLAESIERDLETLEKARFR